MEAKVEGRRYVAPRVVQIQTTVCIDLDGVPLWYPPPVRYRYAAVSAHFFSAGALCVFMLRGLRISCRRLTMNAPPPLPQLHQWLHTPEAYEAGFVKPSRFTMLKKHNIEGYVRWSVLQPQQFLFVLLRFLGMDAANNDCHVAVILGVVVVASL